MERTLYLFKALSDETRLRILKLLQDGELCVCDITAALEMNQPNVSFHLAILKEAGFIKDRKKGRWNHYDLDFSSIQSRILLPTALEGATGEKVAEDRIRLEEFRAAKNGGGCALKEIRINEETYR